MQATLELRREGEAALRPHFSTSATDGPLPDDVEVKQMVFAVGRRLGDLLRASLPYLGQAR
jgi:hypothetical protein